MARFPLNIGGRTRGLALSVGLAACLLGLACSEKAPQVTPSPTRSSPRTVTTKASVAPSAAPLDRVALAATLQPLVGVTFANERMRLLSDVALGIVSNNGGGIVSQNGGNLISDNGSSLKAYGVLQATDLATAREGEALIVRGKRPDGAEVVSYALGKTQTRDVVVGADGRPLQEELTTAIVYHPNGEFREGKTVRRLFAPDGSERARLTYQETYSDAGRLATFTLEPSTFQDPETGVDVAIEKLAVDATAGTGSFTMRYRHLDLVETGTITRLVVSPSGAVAINVVDPLALAAGESTVSTTSGAARYRRTQTLDGATQRATYSLGDALDLVLARKGPNDPFAGVAKTPGGELGAVTFVRDAAGALRLRLVPKLDPGNPLEVGAAARVAAP